MLFDEKQSLKWKNPSKCVEFHNRWVWIPNLPIRNTSDWYAIVLVNLGIRHVELVPRRAYALHSPGEQGRHLGLEPPPRRMWNCQSSGLRRATRPQRDPAELPSPHLPGPAALPRAPAPRGRPGRPGSAAAAGRRERHRKRREGDRRRLGLHVERAGSAPGSIASSPTSGQLAPS